MQQDVCGIGNLSKFKDVRTFTAGCRLTSHPPLGFSGSKQISGFNLDGAFDLNRSFQPGPSPGNWLIYIIQPVKQSKTAWIGASVLEKNGTFLHHLQIRMQCCPDSARPPEFITGFRYPTKNDMLNNNVFGYSRWKLAKSIQPAPVFINCRKTPRFSGIILSPFYACQDKCERGPLETSIN